MDLSNPAAAVLGPNRAKVLHRLSLLADGMSGRALHALSGVKSLVTTQRTLEELAAVGLVDVRPVGAANLYSLNREHVMWPPIEQLLAAGATAEQRIAEVMASTLGDDAAVLLYGSFARNDAGPDSDIDLLVVWKDEIDEAHAAELLDEAVTRIERLTGNGAQIIAMTDAELDGLIERRDPLIDSLREDARSLTPDVRVATLLGGR